MPTEKIQTKMDVLQENTPIREDDLNRMVVDYYMDAVRSVKDGRKIVSIDKFDDNHKFVGTITLSRCADGIECNSNGMHYSIPVHRFAVDSAFDGIGNFYIADSDNWRFFIVVSVNDEVYVTTTTWRD